MCENCYSEVMLFHRYLASQVLFSFWAQSNGQISPVKKNPVVKRLLAMCSIVIERLVGMWSAGNDLLIFFVTEYIKWKNASAQISIFRFLLDSYLIN